MANIWEKAISILAGNLNLGLSYLIITVQNQPFLFYIALRPFQEMGMILLNKVSFELKLNFVTY